MKKKISKIFISTFIVLCVSFMVKSMYARQILDYDELGQQIEKINKDAENAYIVGEYIFTSGVDFKLKDVMLGATSISVSPEDETKPDKMNIYSLSKNFQTNKWELKNNFIGSDTLSFDKDNPITIKYVDYNKLKEAYTVTLDLDAKDSSTGEYPEKIRVDEGKIDASLITGDNAPTREGYKFKEWVKVEDGVTKEAWNFDTDEISGNITLKATWYDEVNTDTLIENAKKVINEGTKTHGYFYDVDFDKTSRIVTFNVYDLNKKNSEIEGTGLIADIVNIVKEENVESITISNGTDEGKVTFGKEDVNNGAGPDSAAWKQFAFLLCKLTNNSCSSADEALSKFINITLGDLAKIQDELTLKVTLNEEKARSQNNNVVEEYKIEFAYDAPATISATIPEDDVKELKDKFNYITENTYKIEGSEGLYNVTEYITEKDDVKNFGDSTTKFYFAYTITLDDNVDIDNVKVKIPKKPKKDEEKTELTDSDYNIVDKLTSNKITVLMEVEEHEEVKYRDVIIEINEVPTRIRIDFSNLKLEKNSKFEVTKDLPESAKTQIKSTFEGWGFKPEDITDFSKYHEGLNISKVDNNNVKIKGLLPLMKLSSPNGFGEDATKNYGYYIVYVIKTEKNVDKGNGSSEYKDVTVTIPQASDSDPMKPSKVLTKESFDTENEIAVLMKLTPRDNKEEQKFKVIVDMDGNGDKCAPYEVIVDYSELEFQQETKADITIDGSSNTTNIPSTDKEQLNNWGYKFPDDIVLSEDNSSHKNDKLSYDASTGLLTGTIKEQKLTGGFNSGDLDSYFYTFTIKPEKVTENIKVKIENKDGVTKEFNYNDFTEENGEYVLTVLQHIPTDFAKCTESDCCNGTGKCEKADKCKKALKITIDSDGDKNNSYKESEVYYIDYCNLDFVKLHTVEFNNNGKSILNEDVYDGEKAKGPENNPESKLHFNTFDYWAQEKETEKVEFDLSTNKITEDITLAPIWEVDVDAYIQGCLDVINQKDNVKNNFNITLDKGSKTLTVNILNNDTKISDISQTAIVSALAHALVSDEVDDISIELADKEAELMREYLPGDEDAIKPQIKQKIIEALEELFTEGGLENTTLKDLCDKCPTSEEEEISKNGLTVFLNDEIAHAEGKSIEEGVNYEIKFERKYEIGYDAGVIDNPESTYVNKGSTLTEEDLPIPNITEDYRTFDGWYKKGKNEKVTNIEQINEDIELEAHYTLNADKFIADVISDLKNPDSTYSADFSGQFELTQNESNKNEINIKVQSPNVKLSKLAETSIPGTIAYILQKGEIQEVTLNVGEQTKTFNKDSAVGLSAIGAQANEDSTLDETGKALKQKIIDDAKNAFDTELKKSDGTEAEATMDQVEFEGTSFTLKIGAPTNDTIKLVNANGEDLAEDTYTFNFDSNFTVIDQKDKLGPDTIKEALDKLDKKDYDTIYIDGDLTEDATIAISTTKDVTIEPVENASKETGLMAIAEAPSRTITVNNNPDYAIDVESTGGKTVTISDLKITGGKYGELKVEKEAKVNATNIDVSGEIEPSIKSDDDEMHAAIVVDGVLTANNIKNDDEKYSIPTIALVTNFSYPKSDVTGEEQESSGNKNLHPEAKVETSTNMTKNDKYHVIKKQDGTKFDSIEETYYGSFYYVNDSNSQIYFMTIIDREIPSSAITFFKIYYYNDIVDIKTLGYEVGKDNVKGDKIFQKLKVENTGREITDNNSKAQDVLISHFTNKVSAVYQQKPKAAVVPQQIEGLTTIDNKISGTLTTQDEEGKYYIPVTLSSEYFVANKSTVKVTNPNNVTETYTYKSGNPAGIATVSTVNTMQIQLEAIKSSNITGENGKVYKIAIDVDGKDGEYEEEIYTIDYNDVKTLEEKINNAADNTKKANSVTIKKHNKINGYIESFDYEYDNEKGLTHITSTNNDNVEQYTFLTKYAGVTDNPNNISVVAQKSTGAHDNEKVYINNWEYLHHQKVGRAIQELTMLTDVMKESHVYNAIDGVKKAEGKEHTYIVTLNSDKYNYWVQDSYLSNPNYSFSEFSKDNKLEVQVELDEKEEYVKSIKTIEENAINNFNVTFEKINETTIKEPKEFLAENGKELTDDDIKTFYEAGKAWWDKYVHENAYDQQ